MTTVPIRKAARNCGLYISDAEREATPRARARRRELQARTDRRTKWVPEVRWEEKGGGVGGRRDDEDR